MDAIFTVESIDIVAAKFWKLYSQKKIWAFHAPMGSGKTTFIHALCSKVLQVTDAVSSPTFAIVNEYSSPIIGSILHMDWYRLKDEDEAINTGIDDAIHSNYLCLIEWPEKALNLLPEDCLHIHIEMLDAQTRRIFIATPTDEDEV